MEKKLKNLQTFEQYTDKNLNISDVSDSNELKKELIKKIWNLSGHEGATGIEIRLPYKGEVPYLNRGKVEKLLIELYGKLPEWW